MGVAHLIGDGAAELSRTGPRYPLLPEDRIALFGFHPYEIEPKEQQRLEQRSAAIAVHFDVDVMDSAEIPLADWPHYDALSFGEAMRCLRVFTASPKLAALIVTEINPDHDPEGLWIRQFVDAFSDALRPVAALVP